MTSSVFDFFDGSADPRTRNWFLVDSIWYPTCITIGYYYFVTKIGPNYMKNRKGFQLKHLIMFYNLLQVFLCFVHVAYYVKGILFKVPMFCMELNVDDPYVNMLMPKLIWYYYMLKYFDLMDTVFFVLTKKQQYVSYLHLFHHISMVFVTWATIKFVPGGVMTFPTFYNNCVHTFMYFYYFATIYFTNSNVKSYKKAVTSLQLFQFLSGNVVLITHVFNPNCGFPKFFLVPIVMHGLYFTYLFGNFYYVNYVKVKK